MPETTRHCRVDSPLGPLVLVSNGRALVRIVLPGETRPATPLGPRGDDEVLAAARTQLTEYFAGARRRFDLPLAPEGTPFQRRVWDELVRLPIGKTLSYKELAHRVASPRGSRAVGAANGRNPLPIVVPCHRVVGADGRLTGFAGGLAAKAWLLRHEGAPVKGQP